MNFNYTYSRTEDNLTARTGYNFDQDWAVGVNDQPHVWNAMVVYNLPFGAEGQAGQRQPGAAGDRQGLADLGDHAVPLGPAARLDSRRLQPAERRHLLRRFQSRPSAATSASTATTATVTCSARARRPTSTARAFQSPAAFTYGNTPRTLAFDLRNPSSFNQDLSVRRDFHVAEA